VIIGVLLSIGLSVGFVLMMAFLGSGLKDAAGSLVERLRWTGVLREVIRADTRMLTDALRLSVAHFQAVNELRKLGGGR
jgi:hypothetical protein